MSVPVWALPSEELPIYHKKGTLVFATKNDWMKLKIPCKSDWKCSHHVPKQSLLNFSNLKVGTLKEINNQLDNPGCKRSHKSYVLSGLDHYIFVCAHKKNTHKSLACILRRTIIWIAPITIHNTNLFWWFRRRKPFGCGWWFRRNNTYKVINYLTQHLNAIY